MPREITTFFEEERKAGEWLLRSYIFQVVECRCLNPFAKCWTSRKRMFGRKCIRVETKLEGPGDPIIAYFYFQPKQWTLRLLKQ